MPSETVRTIVTLLLLFHLFVVGLAVMTSSESGAAKLVRDVKERPGFVLYLTQFWLDRGYDYYLMNDQNWDFHLEATIKYADGRTESVSLPPPELGAGERRQRYQQLAGFVGNYIARGGSEEATPLDTERKLLLPEAIGAGLIQQHPGAESVALKCIYHRGISPRELQSDDPKDRNPDGPQFFVTTGDMTVFLADGRPVVFENSPALEVSPVRRPSDAKQKQPEASKPAANSAGSGK